MESENCSAIWFLFPAITYWLIIFVNRRRDDAETESQNLKRFLRSQSNATFLAFDTEMYEHDRETLLEVGFVEFTLKDSNTPKFSHYIITDNEHIKNGDNVPDNRNRFRFGISQRMSLFEAAAQFRRHIDGADALVVHGGREDTRLLAEQGIRTQNKTMFDTQMIALALLPAGPNYWGLKKIMGELDISYDESILHNGGNDAAYTMKVFCALARELTRWNVRFFIEENCFLMRHFTIKAIYLKLAILQGTAKTKTNNDLHFQTTAHSGEVPTCVKNATFLETFRSHILRGFFLNILILLSIGNEGVWNRLIFVSIFF